MAELTEASGISMNRVNRILSHPMWKACIAELADLEADRRFCRHDIDHLLHVARLAYIESLERNLSVGKECIYAAALLHDIGRGLQYTRGVPHEEAGFALAPDILRQCGFSESEEEEILHAIRDHRDGGSSGEDGLGGLIYRADKLSRNCFCCKSRAECNWKEEKKNKEIRR